MPRRNAAPAGCRVVLAALALSALHATAVAAADLGFQIENLPDPGAEDVWRYTYFPSGVALQSGEGLAVRFDPTEYGAISSPVVSATSDWSAVAIQPDALLPDDGTYDLQAQVADPATGGVFQVDFVWNGTGPPGVQPFVVYDTSFQPLETGQTEPVPEPGAALAAVTAIASLAWLRRRRPRAAARRGTAALVVAAGIAAGTGAEAAAPVLHVYDAGDYRIEYFQTSRTRVTRTLTDFEFAGRIVSETSSSVPRVVAYPASGAASTVVTEDVLVFGDVGAGLTVDSVDGFTLRQDRTVPFDPADVSFAVEVDSAHPCAALSLAASSAGIGEKLPIHGLASADEATLLYADGPQTSLFVPLAQEPDQSFFFSAPVHPDFGGEAGSATIVLETAGAVCTLGSLALPELPTADPDDADEILALTEQLANQILASYAFDPQTFDNTDPDHTATELLLATLWRALLYDGSPTKVSAIRAEVAGLSEDERVFVGRVLLATGIRETLEELLLLYEGFELMPEPPAPSTVGAGAAPTGGSGSGGTGICVPASLDKVSILTAAELSAAMQTAQAAAQSLSREATRRKVATTVFGAAGFAGPAGQAVAVAGGALILAQEAGDENPAKLLPSSIASTRIEVTVNPINEDYMDVPGQERPRWRAFTTATSRGMNLSKRVLDMGLKAAGAVPLPAAAAAPLAGFDAASTWAFEAQPEEATCFTVPPQVWPDINVSEQQWLESEPTLSGGSIALVDTIQIDPVDIGITNIDVRLSSTAFPCEGCTIGEISADVDVEVRAKEIAFTRAQFPIDGSSGSVEVTGTIRNSSRPDLYGVSITEGAVVAAVVPPDPQFSLMVVGSGDDEKFPVTVTVNSNSTTLPAGTEDRTGSADVVLDPMLVLTVLAEACIAPDTLVTIDARVTGFENRDVSFTEPPGATLTPISGSQATFSASQPGTYVVSAASIVDPDLEESVEVVVSDCELELHVYAYGYGEVEGGEQANPPCGTGIDPDDIVEEVELGTRPTGTELRLGVDWTNGGQFPLDIVIEQQTNSTHQPVDVCYQTSFFTAGIATGTLSSATGSAQLDVDLEVGAAGGCEQLTPGRTECFQGYSRAEAIASFVFEHHGESVQAYQYAVDMACSLADGGFGGANIRLVIGVQDAQQQMVSIGEVLEQESLLALVRAANLSCYDDAPVSVQETLEFQKLLPEGETDPGAPGLPYTAAFIVTVRAEPALLLPFPQSGDAMDSGTMQGSISIAPTQPAD